MSITIPSPVWGNNPLKFVPGELSDGAATNTFDHKNSLPITFFLLALSNSRRTRCEQHFHARFETSARKYRPNLTGTARLLVGQGKSARLLHGLKVNDIAMAEMRTRPSVITKSMIVDPFQVVDQAVGLDE